MKEHKQSFQPESVDEQIDQLPSILSPEDMRLVQDLRRTYHPFAEKNIYSLESVQRRLAQSRDVHLASAASVLEREQGTAQPSLPPPVSRPLLLPPLQRQRRYGNLFQILAAVLVVGALLGTFLAAYIAHQPTTGGNPHPSSSCKPWSIISSPNPAAAANDLSGVAAVSANDIWAVGTAWAAGFQVTRPLIEHWNGTSWTIVANPDLGDAQQRESSLSAVAVVSTNDVWAVGNSIHAGTSVQALIEHWNGTQWSIIASPAPDTSSNDYMLSAVAAVSANDVWAVGESHRKDVTGFSADRALIEHWNGAQWSIVASPNPHADGYTLRGVTAISTNNVWAVGLSGAYPARGSLVPHLQTLIEHWNGTQWSIVASPNAKANFNDLHAVAATSANDVWAVGTFAQMNTQGQIDKGKKTLIEHWNGTQWSVVSSPNGVWTENSLSTVTVVSANNAWAIGSSGKEAVYDQPLIEQWNGRQWGLITSPRAQGDAGYEDLVGVTHVPHSNKAWAVGSYGPSSSFKTLTETYC